MSDGLTQLFIEAMAKHLPPSASQLNLLDIGGQAGEVLRELRDDLHVIAVSSDVKTWDEAVSMGSIDAVVAFDHRPDDQFYRAVLRVMRAGGRLIMVNPRGQVSEHDGRQLENEGYTRILIETAVASPLPVGVLIRGEKPHTTSDTLERVQKVAANDDDRLTLADFKGRYVHLLILQTPNKPVWRMEPNEMITWQALAVQNNDAPMLLAFSSLPKAVGFMQPAVIAGHISGINKVGKFDKTVAKAWTIPLTLNPPVDVLDRTQTVYVDIDPNTAEAPDE